MSLTGTVVLVLVELGLLGMMLGLVLPVNRRVGGITALALGMAVLGALLEGGLVVAGVTWATGGAAGQPEMAAVAVALLVADLLVPFAHALALAALVWAVATLGKRVDALEEAA